LAYLLCLGLELRMISWIVRSSHFSLSDNAQCQVEKQCEFESLFDSLCVVRSAAHLLGDMTRPPPGAKILSRSRSLYPCANFVRDFSSDDKSFYKKLYVWEFPRPKTWLVAQSCGDYRLIGLRPAVICSFESNQESVMVILSFLATMLWIAMLIGFLVAVIWVIFVVVFVRGFKRLVHGDQIKQIEKEAEDLMDERLGR
jgi:hypothetical protein